MQNTLEAKAALAGAQTVILEVTARLNNALTTDESFNLLMDLFAILKRLKKFE